MDTARTLSENLASLLRREHGALADFLAALVDFHRARAWAELGYASLFDYLHRELGLSRGAAHYRKVAAELIQQVPAVLPSLREGRLCFSSLVAVSKVVTPENADAMLPRFFHRSRGEALELVAELRPDPAPPLRVAVTAVAPSLVTASESSSSPGERGDANSTVTPREEPASAFGLARPPPSSPPRSLAQPLTADLRRLHLTVSKDFLAKLEAATDALSHSLPGGTAEQVLSAGLDLLLARAAKRRGEVERPQRKQRPSKPDRIPAAVRREVWKRDGGRCQWALASGGICGCTRHLQLDHIFPLALGGTSTADNLRLLCRAHNIEAARRVFGDEWMDRFTSTARPARSRTVLPQSTLLDEAQPAASR